MGPRPRSFLILAIVSTLVSATLSVPVDNFLQVLPALVQRPKPNFGTTLEGQVTGEHGNVDPVPELDLGSDMLVAQERFLQNFFNLSSYLVNAPTDSAALTFVPLGSLLFGNG